MSNFEKWDKEFRAQNLYAFNNNVDALLWLKVRAVCRGKQIEQFLGENELTLKSTKISEQNIELFELLENCDDATPMLDRFLQGKNHEWYTAMGVDEDKLKNANLKDVQNLFSGSYSYGSRMVSRSLNLNFAAKNEIGGTYNSSGYMNNYANNIINTFLSTMA